MKAKLDFKFDLAPLPRDENEAVQWLLPLFDIGSRALRLARADEFKRAWYSIAFLYAGLHPDGALEHGPRILRNASDSPTVSRLELRLVNPYYEQSGWPVVLAPIAKEAWPRYKSGALTDDEFYCSEAQMAGMCCRNPDLLEEVANEREVSSPRRGA